MSREKLRLMTSAYQFFRQVGDYTFRAFITPWENAFIKRSPLDVSQETFSCTYLHLSLRSW